MGLKFKRFRAKLNWKTKETVPDVVCVRYQIHSEFDAVPPPTTSRSQLGSNDVVKQKKLSTKPSLQSVFESGTSKSTNTKTEKVNHNKQLNGALALNQNTAAATHASTPAKGILKKSTLYDEKSIEAPINTSKHQVNQNDTSDKSALIFMTENHDYEEHMVKSEKESDTKEISLASLAVQEATELESRTAVIEHSEEETVQLRFHNSSKTEPKKINEYSFDGDEKIDKITKEHKQNTSESDPEQDDMKTVRWRETVIEIKTPNMYFETDPPKSNANEDKEDDFKVHFVKHHDTTAEAEESEPEEDDHTEVGSRYGSRGAYSSQAASIFFAGEEPEPTPRVRNISQQDDDISQGVHSTA